MVLMLCYKVNEGVRVTEKGISVEVIVRNIEHTSNGARVRFDLRDEEFVEILELSEYQRYDVTPKCTLHVPKSPIKKFPLDRYGRERTGIKGVGERVLLLYYAPRTVDISKRRMYPIEPPNL